jgi:hypothetical protein
MKKGVSVMKFRFISQDSDYTSFYVTENDYRFGFKENGEIVEWDGFIPGKRLQEIIKRDFDEAVEKGEVS